MGLLILTSLVVPEKDGSAHQPMLGCMSSRSHLKSGVRDGHVVTMGTIGAGLHPSVVQQHLENLDWMEFFRDICFERAIISNTMGFAPREICGHVV